MILAAVSKSMPCSSYDESHLPHAVVFGFWPEGQKAKCPRNPSEKSGLAPFEQPRSPFRHPAEVRSRQICSIIAESHGYCGF